MSSKNSKWVGLPFLGASIKGERRDSTLKSDGTHGIHPNGTFGKLIGKDKDAEGKEKTPKRDQNGACLELEHTKTANEVAQMSEEDIIYDYNSPIHMWVVSTLFPLVAGTFGPMASMFNVCAISTSWRIIVNPDSEASGTYIKDPAWLIAVNVVSLVLAVVANLSLLGQMTSRIRYNISGPITIVGFFVSGAVDIILVAVASTILPITHGSQEIYSQAFYYACFSGAIYVVLAFMLSVTAWGIWFGHYSDEFKLSLAQRSLMLQTMLFLIYVLAAAGVYSTVESWDYLNAIYFVVVTLFTIGFGDYVPTTHLGRSLFFPFAVGGIIFVGVIIANIRSVILESGAVKVSTRLVEKARYRAIKFGTPEEGIFKLHGVKGVRKRDVNGETEHHRRRNEFRLMRDIQSEAHLQNRLFSLAFSLVIFMILWFIGAVVFWKSESLGVGGENWSYFDSVYFTFVAQLTIGYGDFEPQDDSAKPAFVFWALIALPSLTVLIGSVGDAVSAVVTWYTTWVGEHAAALHDIFVAIYMPHNSARAKIKALIKNPEGKKDEEDIVEEESFHDIAPVDQQRLTPHDFDTRPFTEWEIAKAEDKYRPFMIVKAMQSVTEHLNDDPPKKYTYREWSWLLKLLGEDETDPEGHRLIGHPLPPGAEIAEPIRSHKLQIWSWLGQESPLMSLQEGSEPRWMLNKLMLLLEGELKASAEKHVERELGSDTWKRMENVAVQQEMADEVHVDDDAQDEKKT